MDIEYVLRNMRPDVKEKVREAVEKYKRTGNKGYAELAISILQSFDDDPAVKELVLTLKR